jgi:hypothetical protein
MRFEVPQFIDIEDKIFGPLTFKQFIYVAGGGGLCYATYKFFPIFIAIPVIIAIAGLSYALAFYKLNGQAFITVGQAFLVYLTKNKLYVWKKEAPQVKKKQAPILTPVAAEPEQKELTARRIQDLARNLDILDKTRYN